MPTRFDSCVQYLCGAARAGPANGGMGICGLQSSLRRHGMVTGHEMVFNRPQSPQLRERSFCQAALIQNAPK